MPFLTLLDLFFGLFVISLVVNVTSNRLPLHYVPSVMRWGWFSSAIYVTIRVMSIDSIQQWLRGAFRPSVFSFMIAATLGAAVGVIYWGIITRVVTSENSDVSGSSAVVSEGVKENVKEEAAIERADIFTTLIIDSVRNSKVKYHLEIKNGQLPVTITNITSYTPEFLQHEEGPYIPKNLRPGENISITGDVIGLALPADKSTNLAVRIGYDAEIKGVRKGFVSSYRFFIDDPRSPRTLLPFSVSHDGEEQSVDPAQAEAANRFALPEATVFLVLPEKKLEDETPNIVSAGNAERRFIFNPEIREVHFESRAQSGRIMRVRLPLSETDHPQGLHLIALLWSRTHALLRVDGVEVQVRDQKPKTGNPRGRKAIAERKTERPKGWTTIAFMALLRVYPVEERRRKYIHDLGSVGRGRFSVYLNEDNRLAFELTDAEGQTHSLEGPPDLPSDFFRIDVQIDRTQQSTRLQMWINQSEADSKNMIFPISVGFDTVEGATLGADLNGENCARMDVAELRMDGQSLLAAQSDMHPTKYVEFNGKQWLRNLGPGLGMRQDIKSAQPVFRSL